VVEDVEAQCLDFEGVEIFAEGGGWVGECGFVGR
jgi:hypothetical protein